MKNLIYILLLCFNLDVYSQDIEHKLYAILEKHVKEFKESYKSDDKILIYYENEYLNPFSSSSTDVILNNNLNIRKYIKGKNTYMILFRFYIKEDKMYIGASHFLVKKKVRGIRMTNLMDGKDYYICDLIEK